MGFPGSSAGKESACNTGNLSLIPGSGRSPGEGIDYPLQYSWASLVAQLVKTWIWSLGWDDPLERRMATHSSILAWEFHGLFSPWGHKGSDTTEWLSLFSFLHACLGVWTSLFVQAGFRKGRGTRDQIANILWMLLGVCYDQCVFLAKLY